MAKKKIATTQSKSKLPSRPKKTAPKKAAPLPHTDGRPLAAAARTEKIHTYRHEIGGNPNHAPLTVELDISAARGARPPLPAFVSFTAELADEQWPDQFAFRLISLQADSVRVKITRVDRGQEELSWGANLVVHVLVVDR